MHDTRLHTEPEKAEKSVNLFGLKTGLSVYSRLHDGTRLKDKFYDEPSKSTEQ